MPRRSGSTPKTPRFPITRISGASTGPNAKIDREQKRARFLRGIILMPQVPITMPQLGESMAEATIVAIKVKPGEKVAADQEIIEVETDKAVMGVTTPCAGRDREDRCRSERDLRGRRGARLRRGERSRRGAFRKKAPAAAAEAMSRRKFPAAKKNRERKTQTASGSHFQVDETACRRSPTGSHFQVDQTGVLPVPASAKGAGYLSPRVRARMAELQLTQADLAGDRRQRKRRPRHDQGSGKFPRRPRKTNRGRRERDPHRRGRCDAAQLDAAARHGRRFRLSRSRARRSQETRSETGPGALCFARARACARRDARTPPRD